MEIIYEIELKMLSLHINCSLDKIIDPILFKRKIGNYSYWLIFIFSGLSWTKLLLKYKQ